MHLSWSYKTQKLYAMSTDPPSKQQFDDLKYILIYV